MKEAPLMYTYMYSDFQFDRFCHFGSHLPQSLHVVFNSCRKRYPDVLSITFFATCTMFMNQYQGQKQQEQVSRTKTTKNNIKSTID